MNNSIAHPLIQLSIQAKRQSWEIFFNWIRKFDGIQIASEVWENQIVIKSCSVPGVFNFNNGSLRDVVYYQHIPLAVRLTVAIEYLNIKLVFPQIYPQNTREDTTTIYKEIGKIEYHKVFDKNLAINSETITSLEKEAHRCLTKDEALGGYFCSYHETTIAPICYSFDALRGTESQFAEALKRKREIYLTKQAYPTKQADKLYNRYLTNRWPKVKEYLKIK